MDISMKRVSVATAGLALGLFMVANARAESPSYDFFELAYVKADIDNPNADGDGFGLGGSVSIHENWFMFADYSDFNLDFGVDLSLLDVGVGYRLPISDTTDLALKAAYVKADASTGFGSADDSGYGIGAQIRGMVNKQLELNGGINYVDFGGSGGDDTSFEAGAVYSFTDNFALDGNFELGDDLNVYTLGFRFYFNK